MTFLFTETYIEKGQKRSKKVTNTICSCLLPVSDYVSKISSPKAAKSRTIGPFTMNDGPKARQCIFIAISSPMATKSRMVGPFTMKNGPKARVYRFRRRRKRSTGRRPVYRCRQCKYFVEEGDKITGRRHVTGRRPVYLRRGCNISSPKATKSRAVCPFNMIDGPKARVPASTV